jgi:hypothetical protein
LSFTDNGITKAKIPRIKKVLAILLPKIFPMAISALPLQLAKILIINSGTEVPKATMVSPITSEDTPNLRAKEEAPSTKKSAPFIRKIKPKTKNNQLDNIFKLYTEYKLLTKIHYLQ